VSRSAPPSLEAMSVASSKRSKKKPSLPRSPADRPRGVAGGITRARGETEASSVQDVEGTAPEMHRRARTMYGLHVWHPQERDIRDTQTHKSVINLLRGRSTRASSMGSSTTSKCVIDGLERCNRLGIEGAVKEGEFSIKGIGLSIVESIGCWVVAA